MFFPRTQHNVAGQGSNQGCHIVDLEMSVETMPPDPMATVHEGDIGIFGFVVLAIF